MCDFRAGITTDSHADEQRNPGISKVEFRVANARFPVLSRSLGIAGAIWLVLLLITFPVTCAPAVTPAPVTNSDGRLGQPVFSVQSRPVASQPAAPDFSEENQRQRWWLLGLMAALLGLAAWYRNSRTQQS
jgi:hypothetical protein